MLILLEHCGGGLHDLQDVAQAELRDVHFFGGFDFLDKILQHLGLDGVIKDILVEFLHLHQVLQSFQRSEVLDAVLLGDVLDDFFDDQMHQIVKLFIHIRELVDGESLEQLQDGHFFCLDFQLLVDALQDLHFFLVLQRRAQVYYQ